LEGIMSSERQVVVAGGTGGLGGAVVRAFLARGAWVTTTYRDEREVERLRASLGGAAERLTTVRADCRREADVEALFGGMARVDALAHLVGGFTMAAAHEMTLEAWQAHVELVLTTTFLTCKHALRRMRAQGYGRIVTIGSRAVEQPGASTAAYAAAKSGVAALTRVIAAETKGTDITANCVMPSIIDTPQNRAAMGDAHAAQWVKPESLAEVIAFLASDEARDVRGAFVPVYGSV
jgi:NAD(P)-dependent dehydrogenase (short-subunit alcohol dehydrogenase family)